MAEFNDKETMPLEEVVQTPEILEELEVESVCMADDDDDMRMIQ